MGEMCANNTDPIHSEFIQRYKLHKVQKKGAQAYVVTVQSLDDTEVSTVQPDVPELGEVIRAHMYFQVCQLSHSSV